MGLGDGMEHYELLVVSGIAFGKIAVVLQKSPIS